VCRVFLAAHGVSTGGKAGLSVGGYAGDVSHSRKNGSLGRSLLELTAHGELE
jgi:hypothetical protein